MKKLLLLSIFLYGCGTGEEVTQVIVMPLENVNGKTIDHVEKLDDNYRLKIYFTDGTYLNVFGFKRLRVTNERIITDKDYDATQ